MKNCILAVLVVFVALHQLAFNKVAELGRAQNQSVEGLLGLVKLQNTRLDAIEESGKDSDRAFAIQLQYNLKMAVRVKELENRTDALEEKLAVMTIASTPTSTNWLALTNTPHDPSR